jgi:hypothetical protein
MVRTIPVGRTAILAHFVANVLDAAEHGIYFSSNTAILRFDAAGEALRGAAPVSLTERIQWRVEFTVVRQTSAPKENPELHEVGVTPPKFLIGPRLRRSDIPSKLFIAENLALV